MVVKKKELDVETNDGLNIMREWINTHDIPDGIKVDDFTYFVLSNMKHNLETTLKEEDPETLEQVGGSVTFDYIIIYLISRETYFDLFPDHTFGEDSEDYDAVVKDIVKARDIFIALQEEK